MGKSKNGNKSLVANSIFSSLRTLTTIIFPLITYPYISRVLSVDNMGRINFGQSIVSYFLLLAGLGISTFAIREGSRIRDDRQRLNIFSSQAFTINVIATVLACMLLVGLVFLPTKIADYREIILILGITIALSPLAVDWLYAVEEDFAYITLRGFCVQLLSLILMFLFVKNDSDVYLYVALTTLASSLGNLFNFFHARKYVHLKLVKDTKWNEYKGAIMLFFVNSIASTIYLNSDATLLSLMSGDRANGLYGVATKVYSIIKQMFNAITGAIIPRLSYLIKNDMEQFEQLLNRIFSLTSFFIIPAIYGIILLREEIILLISGKNYLDATSSLIILAVAIFFAVMANIFVNGLLICIGREKYVLRATIVSATVNVGLNFIFIPWLAQDGAAITTLIAEAIVCVMSFYYAKDYVKKLVDFAELGKSLVGATLMFAIALAARGMFIEQFGIVIRILLTVIVSVLTYGVIMIVLRDKVLIWVLGILREKIKILFVF